MFKPFAFLEPLFPCITRERKARELALQAQTSIRKLSDLLPEESEAPDSPEGSEAPNPPEYSEVPDSDLLSILNSTCLLLDRLVELGDKSPTDIQAETSSTLKTSELEAPPQPRDIAPPPPPPDPPEPEFPKMVKDLIQLRDWVLTAKSGGTGASAEVIESLNEKLGEILDKEGVTTLEETDSLFDYERQQIVSIEVTDDPNKSDRVCSTVRPGYLFQDRIIRSQEVILYSFDNSTESETEQSEDSGL